MFENTIATRNITWNLAQGLCVDEDVVATQFNIGDYVRFTDDNIECDVGEKTHEQPLNNKRMS